MNDFADHDAKAGNVREVTLVVLGAPAVGRSAFVRCALDLKKAPTSALSSKKVSLEGEISIVRMLELGFEDVEVTVDQNVRWPTRMGDFNMPIIDGALVLYDAMDGGSIADILALLSESFECWQYPIQMRKPPNETIQSVPGMRSQDRAITYIILSL